jgi:hypothetical protein
MHEVNGVDDALTYLKEVPDPPLSKQVLDASLLLKLTHFDEEKVDHHDTAKYARYYFKVLVVNEDLEQERHVVQEKVEVKQGCEVYPSLLVLVVYDFLHRLRLE